MMGFVFEMMDFCRFCVNEEVIIQAGSSVPPSVVEYGGTEGPVVLTYDGCSVDNIDDWLDTNGAVGYVEQYRCQWALGLFTCPIIGALQNRNIDRIVGVWTPELCAQACLRLDSCVSFDYSPSGQICLLGDSKIRVDPQSIYTVSKTWNHYEVISDEVVAGTVPLTAADACEPGCAFMEAVEYDPYAYTDDGTCIGCAGEFWNSGAGFVGDGFGTPQDPWTDCDQLPGFVQCAEPGVCSTTPVDGCGILNSNQGECEESGFCIFSLEPWPRTGSNVCATREASECTAANDLAVARGTLNTCTTTVVAACAGAAVATCSGTATDTTKTCSTLTADATNCGAEAGCTLNTDESSCIAAGACTFTAAIVSVVLPMYTAEVAAHCEDASGATVVAADTTACTTLDANNNWLQLAGATCTPVGGTAAVWDSPDTEATCEVTGNTYVAEVAAHCEDTGGNAVVAVDFTACTTAGASNTWVVLDPETCTDSSSGAVTIVAGSVECLTGVTAPAVCATTRVEACHQIGTQIEPPQASTVHPNKDEETCLSMGLCTFTSAESSCVGAGSCTYTGGNTICVPAAEWHDSNVKDSCRENFNATLCLPWTICDDTLQHAAGSFWDATEYWIVSPTAVSDRVCANLTSCNHTTEYQSVMPTPSSDRACAIATVCNALQYADPQLSLMADRVCHWVRNCTDLEWEAFSPTESRDRICVAVKDCNSTIGEKNDEFCIKDEKSCIKNEELCTKNEEICITNDEFRRVSGRTAGTGRSTNGCVEVHNRSQL